MNELEKKIHEESSTCLEYAKFIRILCWINLVSVMIFMGIFLITPQTVEKTKDIVQGKMLILKWFLSFYVEDEMYVNGVLQKWEVIIHALGVLIFALILLWMLQHFIFIFRIISEKGRPFEAEVAKRIKKISEGLTVLLILQMGFFLGVLFGTAVYCVALILEYGCRLQTLEDETV